ncbi:hypothetical protein EDB89DRAFT_1951648 [Lactarius sanguifluus]|nr:hypothetical protein EDB89DRAFT_1951648 [Lactarius sanguifluus]
MSFFWFLFSLSRFTPQVLTASPWPPHSPSVIATSTVRKTHHDTPTALSHQHLQEVLAALRSFLTATAIASLHANM